MGLALLITSCSLLPAERRTMASGSMEPTILVETVVLVDRYFYQLEPTRGDVIIYQASEADFQKSIEFIYQKIAQF